jgi:hypothetical protein
MATMISSETEQYVYVTIHAQLPDGTIINPTGDPVNFAFLGGSESPDDNTNWIPGGWAAGTPFTAQCFVGQSGAVALAPHPQPYTVWVQIFDNPETPVLFAGRLGVS